MPPVARLPVTVQDRLDRAITRALKQGRLPGCVVLLGDSQGVSFRRAYGKRSTASPEPMREDAVFDLASLTKPLTALLVLRQVAAKRIELALRSFERRRQGVLLY